MLVYNKHPKPSSGPTDKGADRARFGDLLLEGTNNLMTHRTATEERGLPHLAALTSTHTVVTKLRRGTGQISFSAPGLDPASGPQAPDRPCSRLHAH